MPQNSLIGNIQGLKGAQGVLLVIAHPDDESMFFAPTLHVLQRQGAAVRILCLSNGEQSCLCCAWPLRSSSSAWQSQPLMLLLLLLLLLCCPLDAGNGDGLGAVREKELLAACRLLQVTNHCMLTRPWCRTLLNCCCCYCYCCSPRCRYPHNTSQLSIDLSYRLAAVLPAVIWTAYISTAAVHNCSSITCSYTSCSMYTELRLCAVTQLCFEQL
jgi:LmbE family N-acetylglucosaminyl deacetylase